MKTRAGNVDNPVVPGEVKGRIQAGLIRIPLEDLEPSEHDTESWTPFDHISLIQLPMFLGKKGTSKTPPIWGDDKLLDAAEELRRQDFAQFQSIIKHDKLWIRVYLTPHPADSEGIDRSATKAAANKVMWRILRGWEWDEIPDEAIDERGGPLIMLDRDPRDISTIYQNLRSPVITDEHIAQLDDDEQEVIWDLQMDIGPAELKKDSKRFCYQNNSVIRMILQELSPETLLDPGYYELEEQGYHGSSAPTYWTTGSVGKWKVIRSRDDVPTWTLPQGGLLCEEMGVGKTLISLCLILATKHLYPRPPVGVEYSTTVTKAAMKFPFPEFVAFRDAQFAEPDPPFIYEDDQMDIDEFGNCWEAPRPSMPKERESVGPPSLRDLAMLKSRRFPHLTPIKVLKKVEGTRVEEMLLENPPFYFLERDVEVAHSQHYNLRAGVGAQAPVEIKKDYTKIYRSNCTLIIVPSLLLTQWKGQIEEHFPSGTFRYKIVDFGRGSAKVPSAEAIVDLNILLLAKERLVREKLSKTELCKVSWKRIMVDEGHFGANGLSGSAMKLIASLMSESRWLITGTPATHLIGNRTALPNLDFVPETGSRDHKLDYGNDMKVDEEDVKPDIAALDGRQCDDDLVPESGSRDDKLDLDNDMESEGEEVKLDIEALDGREYDEFEQEDNNPNTIDDGTFEREGGGSNVKSEFNIELTAEGNDAETGVPSAEAWTHEALADLSQLGKVFVDFLRAPMLLYRGFETTYKHGVGHKKGPLSSSIVKLEQLLQGVLVRNRAEDIEAESKLPRMTIAKTGFVMTETQALTYNFMQAVVVRHIVTTTGTTLDRLFKPSKRGSLLQIVSNLQATGFWYVGGVHMHPQLILNSLENTEVTIRQRLDDGRERKDREEDIALLKEAQEYVRMAIDDDFWSRLMKTESLPIELIDGSDAIPEEVVKEWAQCAGGAPRGISPDGYGLIVAQHLLRIRDYLKNNYAELPTNHLVSLNRMVKRQQKKEAAMSAPKQATVGPAGVAVHSTKPKANVKAKPTRPAMVAALMDAGKANKHQMSTIMNHQDDLIYDDDVVDVDAMENLPASLRSVELEFSTLSAKIAWIVAEVQSCQEDTFVIFSSELNNLAFTKEALDVAHIEICHVSFDSPIEERQANLYLFQTRMKRVCLMDLALAARGLNLVVANRVIFCEPVWKKDVEAQALKRIHRIGQKRECFSTTLYMKNTMEEVKINAREAAADTNDNEDLTDLTIRSLIKRPKFYDGDTARPNTIRTSFTGGPIMSKEEIAEAVTAAEESAKEAAALRREKERLKRQEMKRLAADGNGAFILDGKRKRRKGKGKQQEEMDSDLDELDGTNDGRLGKRRRLSTPLTPEPEEPMAARRKVTFE